MLWKRSSADEQQPLGNSFGDHSGWVDLCLADIRSQPHQTFHILGGRVHTFAPYSSWYRVSSGRTSWTRDRRAKVKRHAAEKGERKPRIVQSP